MGHWRLGRREFLGGAMITALGGVSLTGCGGGGTKTTEPTRGATVTVAPELAGPDRRVRSAYSEPQSLLANGTAETRLTNSGAQLLLLTDASGDVRGLTVVPGGTREATIDALETALALLFITPGVLTTDSQEAATRLTALRNLPTFSRWSEFVFNRLPTTAVAALRGDAEAESLRTVCLAEWEQTRGRATTSRNWQSDFARFEADFGSSNAIRLTSGAWRDAVLLRERFDSRLNQVNDSQPITAPMEGANPPTWGRLFEPAGFTVSNRFDRPEVDGNPPVGLIRYIVYGPGRVTPEVPFPSSLLALDPYGPTFFYTAVLPLVDLVYGAGVTLARGWLEARNVYNQVAGGVRVETAREAIRSADIPAATTALPAICDHLLNAGPTLVSAYGLVGPNRLTSADLPEMVRATKGLLAPSSFRRAVETWTDYPELSVYEVPVTSGEVVVR